ncbi:MAG: Asp-tRNA(Asn)/Glu-tRNA(Gln) amidotransferase subunit GatB, partial [Clostridiales bacterium]|nr:Asp-tRNA(Asn)/Glu-tRNA(Gln) amidotransferase subunit GatB [Clostridiales bacterium]
MYIPVIGLEVHAELLTDSKIFCGCSAEFGGDHNTRCCPGCAGLPGTLPMLNKRAVQYAIRAGFTMNCDINKLTYWDRKNYFYPDLPTAYQISQLYLPLCVNGEVEINVDEQKSKKIRIHQIHLEEDAGKLVHDDFNNVSLADYNRGGIPLIEIVTEPDFSNADEVKEFVEKISLLLQYAGVCECKMEQGQLRVDVNISLMRENDTQLGTRAEIKNLNSIKSITRAIEYEIQRQTKILQNGEKVVQETRRFNENRGTTSSLRSKADAHDYRYFPDPDIPAVTITQAELNEIKAQLPELPDCRLERYIDEYKLTPVNARILIADRAISDFFDEAIKSYNKPK